MKTAIIFLLGLLAPLLAGCNRSGAEPQALAIEAAPAAVYKAGHGVRLTPIAREFVGLASAEFKERLPPAALLRTVQGVFVYVENGEWLLRTPVKLGASGASGASFAVEEGLYEGDVIVVGGVRSLWLAELQFLRAGQACTHKGG